MKQNIFIALLKQFTRFVGNLTEEEISDLETGEKILILELVENNKRRKKTNDSLEFKELADQMMQLDSRDQVESLLAGFKKAKLLELLKFLDIPVQGRENISMLKEKVVESTIGYRLRSQAIQESEK